MEIYVDIIVLENTIVNLFLLLLTSKLLRYKYKSKTLYLASLIGGIYTVVIFLGNSFFTSLIVKILIAMIMVTLTLYTKNIMSILKGTVCFFLLSFMLCGICFSLSMFQNSYIVGESYSIDNYSLKAMMMALMVFYVVVIRIYDFIKERTVVKSFTYDIYIALNDKTLLIKGFLDTGNELREPATNLPCIIIENEYLEHFNVADNEMFAINYKTINEDGKLLGFKSNNIRIRNENNNEWTSVEAIVCGCKNKLSKENEFQALLSRGIV